jgi:hypothetical protein
MAVTDHPPHRPVLAALPHTVLTSDAPLWATSKARSQGLEGDPPVRPRVLFRAHHAASVSPVSSPTLSWVGDGLHVVLLSQRPSLRNLRLPRLRESCRLLRWYYASVRLLARVPARIALLASRASPAAGKPRMTARSLGSRAPRGHPVSRRAHGSWTTPGLMAARVIAPLSVAFPLQAHGRRPNCVFRSSIPGPSIPLSTLHPAPRGAQRKTRGQDGSLFLSCGAPSSPTTRRFIRTIALADARGSRRRRRSTRVLRASACGVSIRD